MLHTARLLDRLATSNLHTECKFWLDGLGRRTILTDARYSGGYYSSSAPPGWNAGYRLLKWTAFHPETDGQAENSKKMVIRYLQAFATSQVDEWDQLLSLAEFAYNSSIHLLLYRAKSHVGGKNTVAKTRKNVAEHGKPRG
jgi:hypothetical protein